jgi:hypothetical protein
MKTLSKIAKLVWNVIRNASSISMSWGIDCKTIESDENLIRFHVQGFLHKGTVEVKYNQGTDLFEISLFDESGNLTEKLEDIYIDQLVDVIDNHIENNHSEDYDSKVDDWLREQSISAIIIFD